MVELAHSSTTRKTIRDQVTRHPLLAFMVLACALSSAWLLSFWFNLGMANGFGILGSASPALAAMIVSALLGPEPSGVPAGKRWRLFGIVGILALAVMAALRLWHAAGRVTIAGLAATAAYPSRMALVMDVLAAAVVALILSGVHSPRQGVRDLLHSLDPRCPPVRWTWWVIAVGAYPVVVVLGNVLSAGLGLPQPAPKVTGPWYWLALDVLITFLYFLFGGGGLEEPGWRGFALPLLQKRYSPLRSSLILGVLWTLWHWPYVFEGGPLILVVLLVQIVPFAILFTAVFNRTGGSLPIVILLHTSINVTEQFLPVSTLAMGLWILPTLGMALWMWQAPQNFSLRHV